MINYTAWISLFAISMELIPATAGLNDIEVKTYWKNMDHLFVNNGVKGMCVEFNSREAHKNLFTYTLIPWQDLTYKNQMDNMAASLAAPQLICVSPFAIIFQESTPENDESEIVVKEKISNYMEELLNIEASSREIESADGISLQDYRLISIREFPFYLDLNIAATGSQGIEPGSFDEITQGKMVLVRLTPDMGEVRTSWIKNEDPRILLTISSFQDELIRFLQDQQQRIEKPMSIGERNKLFDEAKSKLRKVFLENSMNDSSVQDFYAGLLRRLLFAHEIHDLKEISHPVFGNYQPKETPDMVTDYMPGIIEELSQIPEANMENLKDLISLFKEYKIKAAENPGETVEGNVVLGGMPEEYKPSEEELMLGEIGERIMKILENNDKKEIKKYCRSDKIKEREIEFVKFSFIHYDVMGSGRFFYIGDTDTINLKLP